ncbi:MAG: N-formylglutamate amidohydrolase [Pseudomonadota bacterium]
MLEALDQTAAFHVTGRARGASGARWVICCDHATNRVPDEIGALGLPEADMARHIAYDIGALGVSLALGEALDAPVVSSNFSRLVIDPNRGEDDPTLVMQLYDGSIIPGNRQVDAEERARRLAAYHRPYHAALAEVMSERDAPILVSVHSFTPQLRGRARRPWEVGVLFAEDRRLSDPFAEALAAHTPAPVGLNEPYGGKLPGDTVDTHALCHGHLNALIELRQDLIEDQTGQHAWAEKLSVALLAAHAAVEA